VKRVAGLKAGLRLDVHRFGNGPDDETGGRVKARRRRLRGGRSQRSWRRQPTIRLLAKRFGRHFCSRYLPWTRGSAF